MFIGMPTRCNISHNLVMYSLRMTRRENEKDGCGAHLLLRRHVCHVAMPLCPDTLMLVDVNSSCIWRPMSFCLPEDAAQDRKGGQCPEPHIAITLLECPGPSCLSLVPVVTQGAKVALAAAVPAATTASPPPAPACPMNASLSCGQSSASPGHMRCCFALRLCGDPLMCERGALPSWESWRRRRQSCGLRMTSCARSRSAETCSGRRFVIQALPLCSSM